MGSIASKHLIWRLEQNAIHPFARSVLHLTEQQQQDEKVYLQMLSEVLSLESFYYSTTYDLTHSMQRLTDTSPDFRQLGLFERVSSLFIFYSQISTFFFILVFIVPTVVKTLSVILLLDDNCATLGVLCERTELAERRVRVGEVIFESVNFVKLSSNPVMVQCSKIVRCDGMAGEAVPPISGPFWLHIVMQQDRLHSFWSSYHQ